MPLLCAHLIILAPLLIVLVDSISVMVAEGQVILGCGIALRRALLIVFDRLGVVFLHALAVEVATPQIVLRYGKALIGR